VQKRNAARKLGHSCFKKVAASIRMLCWRCYVDTWMLNWIIPTWY
jgi:hypothetical protein